MIRRAPATKCAFSLQFTVHRVEVCDDTFDNDCDGFAEKHDIELFDEKQFRPSGGPTAKLG